MTERAAKAPACSLFGGCGFWAVCCDLAARFAVVPKVCYNLCISSPWGGGEKKGKTLMTVVKFYDEVEDERLKFAVILTQSDGKWVFCKHKERDTLEVPGGHREPGEEILAAAKRELYEETGAVSYTIRPICAYSVTAPENFNGEESFGMLYWAEVTAFERELHSEIERIILTEDLPERWTYPEIQPKLLQEAQRRGYAS